MLSRWEAQSACYWIAVVSRLAGRWLPAALLLFFSAQLVALSGETNLSVKNQEQQLARIRGNVIATIFRLPKYLCTQTIDRAIFFLRETADDFSCEDAKSHALERKFRVFEAESDRLRLDVAVSREEGEMYSWVGENRFHDRSLAELVGSGVTSTGTFSGFLRAIFSGGGIAFNYTGEEVFAGRKAVGYHFRVASAQSTYTIGNESYHTLVAYSGQFLADANTFDLLRLLVRAENLPQPLRSCQDTTTLDYSMVRLNGQSFLLPQRAELRIQYDTGAQSDNVTVFSGCHEFTGESKVSFDDPDPPSPSAAEKLEAEELQIPSNVGFTLRLTQRIPLETAAAGDPFTARLTSRIRGGSKQTLIQKGALVRGRLTRVERLYNPPALTIGVRLETISNGTATQPFPAKLINAYRRMGQILPEYTAEPQTSFDGFVERKPDRLEGVLRFEGFRNNYVLESGFEMEGRTLKDAP